MMIFKHRIDQNRFFCLHPVLMMIAADMYSWCMNKDIPFIVTDTVSTIKEDKKLKRVSSTHRTCRAIDIRSWVFSEDDLYEFINHFNRKYKNYAATTRDGSKMLVLYHGKNPHLHVQIHSRYAKNNPLDDTQNI